MLKRCCRHPCLLADPLALWKTVMGGVVGGIQVVLPTAFDPLPASDGDGRDTGTGQHEQDPQDFQSPSFETSFPSNGEDVSPNPTEVADATGDILGVSGVDGGVAEGASLTDDSAAVKSAVAAMGLRSTVAMHPDDSALVTVLLPLLARLPPVCPPAGRPSALPSLLLLSVRVMGSVVGHLMAKGSGLNTSDDDTGSDHLPADATAAVEFVRASVREVWKHGGAALDDAGDDATGVEDSGDAQDVVVGKNSSVLGDVTDASDEKGAPEAVEGDDDDDWGDEDFQGADEATEEIADTAATATTLAKMGTDGSLVEVGEASGAESVVDHGDEKDGIEGAMEAVSTPAEDLDVSQGNANMSGVPHEEDVSVAGAVSIEEGPGGGSERVVPAEGESVGQVVGGDKGVGADGTKEEAPMIVEGGQELSTSNFNLQAESDPVCSGTDITRVTDGGSSGGAKREESVTCVPNARSLVLGAGRAVNELLEDLLRRGDSGGRYSRALPATVSSRALATAIGVAAEAWGAIASEVPDEAEGLSGPLRTALSCPVDRCSVALRHALFGAVAATVAAAAKDENDSSGGASIEGEGKRAAGVMLRMLVPHALAGLRLEIDRAAAAASAPMNGKGVRGEDERAQEACILEGVRVSQIAFKVSLF